MLAKIIATIPSEFVQGNIYPAVRAGHIDPLRLQETAKVQPVLMVVAANLGRVQESPAGRARMRRDTSLQRFIDSIDREDIFNTPDFCCRRARGQSGQHFFPTRWTVTPAFALVVF
ncbi:hypothetical protein MSHOH_2143 [Methanosarcina horonobensis HB-1 = JCM 15518]|uniref:Uncharacterized protein n=1 Tax=Methanosarcina horonobensis HB-1 = JCM 15518 TaxID=1434110 RepID=A0A0E3SCL2_9EURY|nr:hypothetical protein MSHOH_2143 [Methanosarcina horonobensis HB-1 = JCM 15518]